MRIYFREACFKSSIVIEYTLLFVCMVYMLYSQVNYTMLQRLLGAVNWYWQWLMCNNTTVIIPPSRTCHSWRSLSTAYKLVSLIIILNINSWQRPLGLKFSYSDVTTLKAHLAYIPWRSSVYGLYMHSPSDLMHK